MRDERWVWCVGSSVRMIGSTISNRNCYESRKRKYSLGGDWCGALGSCASGLEFFGESGGRGCSREVVRREEGSPEGSLRHLESIRGSVPAPASGRRVLVLG